jgi:DNA-binding response OmpR family regulator
MRLLVIEDNRDILANVADYLGGVGHRVDCASNGPGGLHLALTETYDLIVLDVMLPGMDGFAVCKALRDAGRDVAIIMLTARDELDDRLLGLGAGADDYLVKPFALSELAARIDAVTRRSRKRARQWQVGDLVMDIDSLQVQRAGHVLKMNPSCLTLLELLLSKSPAVVRRDVLEEALWGDEPPSSDGLRSHMHMLRQIVDKPFARSLLHTVHGIGYRLADTGPDASEADHGA